MEKEKKESKGRCARPPSAAGKNHVHLKMDRVSQSLIVPHYQVELCSRRDSRAEKERWDEEIAKAFVSRSVNSPMPGSVTTSGVVHARLPVGFSETAAGTAQAGSGTVMRL